MYYIYGYVAHKVYACSTIFTFPAITIKNFSAKPELLECSLDHKGYDEEPIS